MRSIGEVTSGAPLPLEVEEYLTWLAVERGRRPNTVASYRRDLRDYLAYLGERGVDLGAVDEGVLVDFLGARTAVGLAPASVKRAMVTVRNLHRFLADEGMTDRDPTTAVELPRPPQAVPKALAEEDITMLLDAVVGEGAAVLRDRAILEVLYGTGLRISELCGLSLSDLDLASSTLRAFGKGGKERVVPIGRMAAGALEAWLGPGGRPCLAPRQWARRGDAEAVFLNQRGGRLTRSGAWGIIKAYGDRVGIGDRLHPHVLRHSCATHMLDHGADIRIVQELLGHASLSTTQIYTKVSTERLRSAYDAAHPRARRS